MKCGVGNSNKKFQLATAGLLAAAVMACQPSAQGDGEPGALGKADLFGAPTAETSGLIFTTFNTGLSDGHVDYYHERKPAVIAALSTLATDVLCLQEVWAVDDADLIIEELSGIFPHSAFFDTANNWFRFKRGSNGLLLLSKLPIVHSEYEDFGAFFLRRGAIHAVLEGPDQGELNVVCTHLSTHLNFPPYWGSHESWEAEQIAQAEILADGASADVIMGDFNSGLSVGERITAYAPEAFERFVDGGFLSPYMTQEEPLCTWCESNPIAGGGYGDLVLDHVFLGPRLAEHEVSVARVLYSDVVVQDDGAERLVKLSDHAGVSLHWHNSN
jgi:endonuclease/exonuclease/phosphatase family metal-dependent hydrolase